MMTMPEPRLKLVDDNGTRPTDDSARFDPFDFGSKRYSRDDKHIRSKDRDKEDHLTYLKTPMSLVGMVGTIVHSGAFPGFRTTQDFMRDAIYHHCKYYADKMDNGELDRELDTYRMLSRLEARNRHVKDMLQILAETEANMQMCVDAGDVGILEELLQTAELDFDELPGSYQQRIKPVIEKYRGILGDLTAKG